MAARSYDPKKISVIVGAQPMSGLADGDFVQIEFNEDHWTLMVGADGESTRAKNANRSGKVTITLLHSSLSNDYLSQLQKLDDASGRSPFPLLIKDSFGTSLYSAATAWISKHPNATFGKDASTREWQIETDELIAYTGGLTA